MIVKREKKESNFKDRVVSISRVTKVVKGGRRFSFSALVVVGDELGKVGFAVGKANEVPDAIKKGSEQAKKNLKNVFIKNGTLICEVDGKHGSSLVKMSPAKEGKGVIAGGAVRTVVELAGYKDIVCKVHGSKNGYNVVRATFDGLMQISSIEENTKYRQA